MGTIVSKKMRAAARDEQCTVNFAGICNYDTSTSVLAHLPDMDSNGMGTKADDISSAIACSRCHDVIDSRDKKGREGFETGELDWYLRRAQTRTIRRMIEKGVITICR